MKKKTIFSTLLVVLGACGVDPADPNEDRQVKVINDGAICVFPQDSQLSIAQNPFPLEDELNYLPGTQLEVDVGYLGCLSSSCDYDRQASCTVTETSSRTLTVNSELSWMSSRAGADAVCTADCGFLVTRCKTATLAPGSYQLIHGDQTLSLKVGQTQQVPCAE